MRATRTRSMPSSRSSWLANVMVCRRYGLPPGRGAVESALARVCATRLMRAAATCIACVRSMADGSSSLVAQRDAHHAEILPVKIAGQLVIERGLGGLEGLLFQHHRIAIGRYF